MNEQIPPNSLDAEQAVLGSLLKDPSASTRLGSQLGSEHFYSPANKRIFETIMDLVRFGEPADITTVANELKSKGLLEKSGSRVYLVELVECVASTANVKKYADIVFQKYLYRRIILNASEYIASAYSEEMPPDKLLSQISQSAMTMAIRGTDYQFCKMGDFIPPIIEELDHIQQGGPSPEIPFGYEALDRIASCRKGEFIVIAGRPRNGKSAFMNCTATYQAEQGKRVAVFSTESKGSEWSFRSLCTDAQLDSRKLRRGEISDSDWQKLTETGTKLKNLPYWLDETPQIDIGTLVMKANQLKSEHDIDIIYVDYLQKLSTTRNLDTRNSVSLFSQMLTNLASNLNIPVVAATMISRNVESRGRTWEDKRPKLADLKESGNIEQDAHLVIALFRPELYVKDTAKNDHKNICECLILKQRNGPEGTLQLFFDPTITRFENMGWNESQEMF